MRMSSADIGRFRNKIVEVDAVLFDGANARDIIAWVGADLCKRQRGTISERLIIVTPEGGRYADAGDWIIRDRNGDVYPYKSDLFQMRFEIA